MAPHRRKLSSELASEKLARVVLVQAAQIPIVALVDRLVLDGFQTLLAQLAKDLLHAKSAWDYQIPSTLRIENKPGPRPWPQSAAVKAPRAKIWRSSARWVSSSLSPAPAKMTV